MPVAVLGDIMGTDKTLAFLKLTFQWGQETKISANNRFSESAMYYTGGREEIEFSFETYNDEGDV